MQKKHTSSDSFIPTFFGFIVVFVSLEEKISYCTTLAAPFYADFQTREIHNSTITFCRSQKNITFAKN